MYRMVAVATTDPSSPTGSRVHGVCGLAWSRRMRRGGGGSIGSPPPPSSRSGTQARRPIRRAGECGDGECRKDHVILVVSRMAGSFLSPDHSQSVAFREVPVNRVAVILAPRGWMPRRTAGVTVLWGAESVPARDRDRTSRTSIGDIPLPAAIGRVESPYRRVATGNTPGRSTSVSAVRKRCDQVHPWPLTSSPGQGAFSCSDGARKTADTREHTEKRVRVAFGLAHDGSLPAVAATISVTLRAHGRGSPSGPRA